MDMTDQIVQRRATDWYLGKAVFLTGALVNPGLAQGYYRVKAINPDGSWDTEWISSTMPVGEPVYIHDGVRRDLKAIPSTVIPAAWKWLLWLCIYIAVAAFMLAITGGDGGIFWPLILSPIACQPLYDWYMAVEPVRGTKTSLAIFGVEGALAAKRRHDAQEITRINEIINRGTGR